MTKVEGPLFSVSASGSIGKAITYTSAKGVKIVKAFFKSKDKKSATQLERRGIYQDGVTAWNNLSDPEKEVYNENAKVFQYTGFNLFMKEWLNEYDPSGGVAEYSYGKYGVHDYGTV